MTDAETRRARLKEIVADTPHVDIYDDETKLALAVGVHVPRYLLSTSEGSSQSTYADNPNLTVHETLADVARAIEGELSDEWTPNQIIDLDTGRELDWSYKVTVFEPKRVQS